MRRTGKLLLLFLLTLILLCGCEKQPKAVDAVKTESEVTITDEISEPALVKKPDPEVMAKKEISENSQKFSGVSDIIGYESIDAFSGWIKEKFGSKALTELADMVGKTDQITSGDLMKITGYGAYALSDLFNKRLEPDSKNYNKNITNLGKTDDGITELGFVGDLSFADNSSIMYKYDRAKKGLDGILDSKIADIMKSVDIMTANNEFTLSSRGGPIPKKAYTFRGKPERASIWKDMGVDLVSLANNHAYDFGIDSFLDTLDTLDGAGIKRMGAGRNIAEANKPIYYIVNGYKIAYCAATRAEKNVFTPKAGENTPGVMYTYNSADFCAEIAEAKKQSDFVFVYVHWGYEYTTTLETVQIKAAKEFVDSGADVIIGDHAHILQGIDTYKGKMIFYNLGNFLFNSKSIATGVLKTSIDTSGKLSYKFFPCYQENCHTRLSSGDEYTSTLDLLRSVSPNMSISDTGEITQKTK